MSLKGCNAQDSAGDFCVIPITEPDSKQHQRRTDILTCKYPISSCMEVYLNRLKKGSDIWDEQAFIEGIRAFADLCGSKRTEYYNKPWKGLHYPHTFRREWNLDHPELHIFLEEEEEEEEEEACFQCPPSWESGCRGKHLQWTLTRVEDLPLSRSLNELITETTTIDCGMWNALVIWFGIRYVVGDEWLDRFFPFKSPNKPLVFTQSWQLRMEKDYTSGNLLHDLYDRPSEQESPDTPEPNTLVQARTVFNHPLYWFKRPWGTGRLQNVIQIGADYLCFDPSAPNILSRKELDEALRQRYNAQHTSEDDDQLKFYKTYPGLVHPRRPTKTFGDLAKEADELMSHTLSQADWDRSKADRTRSANGLRLIFNTKRLLTCLEDVRELYLEGQLKEGDFFDYAKRRKTNDVWKTSLPALGI
ncbi:hypothetical protein DM02DRAFT_434232 [Periconia macrospinosa]|uniref:Uncharacterized protein n=1 Tax=Periconia macrospinosa TaxID=97972 RepID=A0A2V1CYJ5_9PLEO|nr:hypothetical protein DM02DRAFT_434232 [Periconia macrospinosa]